MKAEIAETDQIDDFVEASIAGVREFQRTTWIYPQAVIVNVIAAGTELAVGDPDGGAHVSIVRGTFRQP
jgi:hypothetical protein